MKTIFDGILEDKSFDQIRSRTSSLSFFESDKLLFSYEQSPGKNKKINNALTIADKKFRMVVSFRLNRLRKEYLSVCYHTLFYALINLALKNESARNKLEINRHLLFAQTLGAISSTVIENVDITRHLKLILEQIATFINSSAGLIYIRFRKKLAFECFGINKKDITPTALSDPLSKKDLAELFPWFQTCMISDLKLGNKIIGQLIFINKESRTGIEDFSSLDSLLIETIANQIIISLKKVSYFQKLQEQLNLTKTVINSINSSIIAVDSNQKIIIANQRTNELFNHSINLQNVDFADIFPKASPLKNYIQNRLGSTETFIPQTLLLSVTDPKLIRVNASPLKSAKEGGSVIVFEDVTEVSRVKENFSKYVSAELLEQFSKNSYRTRLGGELITAAIFFSDIRGFTTLSEHNSAEDIVDTLNQYYNLMIGVVYENDGYVDKLVGDEIMAVFKIKDNVDTPANRAVQAAVEMKKKLEYFNQLRTEQGFFTLNFGVGINYGEVIIGNIGSFNRMDYTVIGDNVNLAARLCAKAEPNQVLISESAQKELYSKYNCNFIEDFFAKGKKQAVKIYEVK